MSLNFLAGLSSGLLPHGVCFQLRPDLIWLHVASDTVTAIAYLMIPAALLCLWLAAAEAPTIEHGG